MRHFRIENLGFPGWWERRHLYPFLKFYRFEGGAWALWLGAIRISWRQ